MIALALEPITQTEVQEIAEENARENSKMCNETRRLRRAMSVEILSNAAQMQACVKFHLKRLATGE